VAATSRSGQLLGYFFANRDRPSFGGDRLIRWSKVGSAFRDDDGAPRRAPDRIAGSHHRKHSRLSRHQPITIDKENVMSEQRCERTTVASGGC
jgi:hypothetical protein